MGVGCIDCVDRRPLVTGVVVDDAPDLPREVRRRRRAIEHRPRTTGKATLTEPQLAGWKADRHRLPRARRPGA
jgi:hypothetical protein